MPELKLRLYEVAEGLRLAGERLDEAGGELTPELEAELDGLSLAMEAKAEGIAALVAERHALADAIGEEGLRLAARATTLRAGADRLKEYLRKSMEAAGVGRVDTPRFTVYRQANPPSYQWAGETEAIPADFRRVVVSVSFDAAKAKALHKAGETLPEGVVVRVGEHLRIR